MEENENKKRTDTLFWGAIFIWAGLIFGVDSMGLLDQFGNIQAWTWVLLGAGILVLSINLWRLTSSEISNPVPWDWIFTAFFLIGGLSGFGFNFDLAWPIILIIIGVGILGNVLIKRE